MTFTDTLPIPRPAVSPEPHEHSWFTESQHPTSEGIVVYVRCGQCTARRVDLHASPTAAAPTLPPTAMSRSLGESLPITP